MWDAERIERAKEVLSALSVAWSVFVRIREAARNADLALAGALSGMLFGLLAALYGLPETAETERWAVYALSSAAGMAVGGAAGRGIDRFLAGIAWLLGGVRWFFEPTVTALRDRLEALARGPEVEQTPPREPSPAPAARPRTASLSDDNRARATDASEEDGEEAGPLARV